MKQNIVTKSSAEVEFWAFEQGICEELWLKKLLTKLQIDTKTPIKVYCNNKTVINISLNQVQHDRTKHIELVTYFIKEKVEVETICMINIYDPTWGEYRNPETNKIFFFLLVRVKLVTISNICYLFFCSWLLGGFLGLFI